jgi:hypothetical protein
MPRTKKAGARDAGGGGARPELRIEYMPLSGLKKNPSNPKHHAEEILGASFSRFGFVAPMILDERTGMLAAGHGRYDLLVGLKGEGKPAPSRVKVADGEWLVPVIRGVSFQNDAEAAAYLVADNKTTEAGGWDLQMLTGVLNGLSTSGLGLSGVGFSEVDLDKLLTEFPVDLGLEDMARFKKPQVAAGIEDREVKEDGNWLYVEWYGDAETFAKVKELVGPHLRTPHEVKREAFVEMLELYARRGPKKQA